MSHLDFARPGGVWANEFVPGAGDFYRWDLAQSKIVSGDLGGSWAPIKPIILGGAGVQFTSAATQITGGYRTQTGGRLVLGAHDIITFADPRTRKITMSLLGVTPSSLLAPNVMAQFTSAGGKLYTSAPDTYFAKAPPPFASGLFLEDVGQPIAIPIPKAYTHTRGLNNSFDGMLASVTLNYRVLQRPGGISNFGLTAVPFLSIYSELGPGDTTLVPPAGPSQLRAALKFSSSAFWEPSSPFTLGQYFVPISLTSVALAGTYFKVTDSTGPGLTGVTFPTWNTTPGGTTVDGNLTWTCIGGNGQLFQPTLDALYDAGAPQSITLNLDTSIAQALDTANHYFLVGINPPQDSTLPAPFNTIPILYHSIQFHYVNILTLTGQN